MEMNISRVARKSVFVENRVYFWFQVTHSQQHACPKCSFLTDNEDSLREHVHEAHDVSDFEVLTDEEARTPKTNSQGKVNVMMRFNYKYEYFSLFLGRLDKTNKHYSLYCSQVKTFKCKQCGYYATTKMDFWEHTKTHIRSEKMLTCPKCPFVTEYKHHLEYHLRNHFGSKPFQCNKCPYSCVNKSMLNSHLKSHSNIYQYRCADCSYATKYCHSLKLHLRKYNHKPAMVLNPDGTPNPLPIIDVYGTRRGPKIKRSPSDQSNIATIQELLSPPERVKEKPPKSHKNAKRSARESRSTPVPVSTAHCTTPPISPQFVKQEIKNEFIPQSRPSPRNEPSRTELSNTNMDFGRVNNNELLQQRTQQSPMQVPVMNSMSPSAIQGLLMSNSARGTVNPAAAIALQSLFMQNSGHQNVMDLVVKNPMELYAAALNQYILGNSVLQISSPMDFAKVAEEQRSNIMAQLMQQNANIQLIQQSSSPNHVEQKQNHSPALQTPMTNNMNHQTPLDLRNHRSVDDNANEFGEDLKRRKRKGKAHRYDRERDMNPNPQDCDEAIDFSNNNGKVVNPNMNGLNQMKAMKSEESLACRYCDISFPPVLHSLHMKFHSNDADPFRCNACGEKTSDKVSFFVHLANASH
jgi:hypothetical protein